MTELAGKVIVLQQCVEGVESARDPFTQPRGQLGVVELEGFTQVTCRAGVLQGLDVADDDLRVFFACRRED